MCRSGVPRRGEGTGGAGAKRRERRGRRCQQGDIRRRTASAGRTPLRAQGESTAHGEGNRDRVREPWAVKVKLSGEDLEVVAFEGPQRPALVVVREDSVAGGDDEGGLDLLECLELGVGVAVAALDDGKEGGDSSEVARGRAVVDEVEEEVPRLGHACSAAPSSGRERKGDDGDGIRRRPGMYERGWEREIDPSLFCLRPGSWDVSGKLDGRGRCLLNGSTTSPQSTVSAELLAAPAAPRQPCANLFYEFWSKKAKKVETK